MNNRLLFLSSVSELLVWCGWCVRCSTSPCLGRSCRKPGRQPLYPLPQCEKDVLVNALEITVLWDFCRRIFPWAPLDASLTSLQHTICIDASAVFQDFLQHAWYLVWEGPRFLGQMKQMAKFWVDSLTSTCDFDIRQAEMQQLCFGILWEKIRVVFRAHAFLTAIGTDCGRKPWGSWGFSPVNIFLLEVVGISLVGGWAFGSSAWDSFHAHCSQVLEQQVSEPAPQWTLYT